MSKKLNIIEAMKMPIGTRFNVSIADTTVILKSHEEGGECLYWENKNNNLTKVWITDETINAEYMTIQKPVSFMEVVKSKKRCMVKHELINNTCLDKEDRKLLTEFNSLDWILFTITNKLNDVKEIILDGKWYIEESEADSNE